MHRNPGTPFPKIKFRKNTSSFYTELNEELRMILTEKTMRRAKNIMIYKFIIYSSLFIMFYANLFNPYLSAHFLLFIVNYILVGLSGILLAFNCAHDAAHDTFSKYKRLNRNIFYWIFNLQGVNAALWRKRHIASHHIFANVDGCDADIDDNPFMRLSATHAFKRHHKYQHLFSPILYCFYTLHWIIAKDIIYLRRKNVANLKNQSYSAAFIFEVVALKLGYVFYIVALPVWFTAFSLPQVLIAFLLMHIIISLFFVFTLIISHLCLETAFPVVDESGNLPFDYYEHQLAVSLDYHPESKFANWIFGGFNSHAAHHLFPKYPHTIYPAITQTIRLKAKKFHLPYNVLPMHKAILSHFKYLKMMGRQDPALKI